jgi:hypothetical protein
MYLLFTLFTLLALFKEIEVGFYSLYICVSVYPPFQLLNG